MRDGKLMYKFFDFDLKSLADKDGYQLIVIREEDMESIRCWRNEQQEILRQKSPISVQEQRKYYESHIVPSFSQKEPSQILFSFLFKENCIGYGGLTHIDWECARGEVSFLLANERVKDKDLYRKEFTHFLSLLRTVAFEDLQFHRLFTETFAFRKDHIQVLEDVGFVYEGTLRDHIIKNGKWHDSIMHGLLRSDTS